jgi:hypothetical protein
MITEIVCPHCSKPVKQEITCRVRSKIDDKGKIEKEAIVKTKERKG